MNYYNEIRNKLIDNEIYSRVKDYSKEWHKVITYFEIGKLLNEVGGKYGDNIIDEYSKKLVVEVGKKYNRRTLFRMKQFYNIFSNEKVSQFATQLSWSHYVELLPLKNIDEISEKDKIKYVAKNYKKFGGKISFVEFEGIDISSTKIREDFEYGKKGFGARLECPAVR